MRTEWTEWHEPGQCEGPFSDRKHEHMYSDDRLRTDEQIQQDLIEAKQHEDRISAAVKQEQMIREIHQWLAEIMPAARMAMKLMQARHNLMSRWLGAGRKD